MAEEAFSKTDDMWNRQFKINEKLNSDLDEIQEMLNSMMDMIQGLNKSSSSQIEQSPSSSQVAYGSYISPSLETEIQVADGADQQAPLKLEGPEVAHNLFDEMPRPPAIELNEVNLLLDELLNRVPVKNSDNVFGVHGFPGDSYRSHLRSMDKGADLYSELAEEDLVQLQILQPCQTAIPQVDEGEKFFSSKIGAGGLEIGHHMFDEMPKNSYVVQNKGTVVHGELIVPHVGLPRDLSYGSEVTELNSFNISSNSKLEELSMFIDIKNLELDVDFGINGMLIFLFDPGGWKISSLNDRSYFIWEELSDNISWNCFYNHVSEFVMIILLSRRLALEDGLWYEVDRVSTGRWDPGYRIMYFYILEDKDVLKGNGIAVRLALKQDEGPNGAFAYYSAHMALSLIDQDYDGRKNNRAIIRNVPDSLVVIRLEQRNYYGNDAEATMLKVLKVERVGELSRMYRFSPTSGRIDQKQNEFLLQTEPNPDVVAGILRTTYFDNSSLDTLHHELHDGEHMIYTHSISKFRCYIFDPGGGSFFLITWSLEIYLFLCGCDSAPKVMFLLLPLAIPLCAYGTDSIKAGVWNYLLVAAEYYLGVIVAESLLCNCLSSIMSVDGNGGTTLNNSYKILLHSEVQVIKSKMKRFDEMINVFAHNRDDLFMEITCPSFMDWLKRKACEVSFTVIAFDGTMNHYGIIVGALGLKVMYATLLIFLLRKHGVHNAVKVWNLKWLGLQLITTYFASCSSIPFKSADSWKYTSAFSWLEGSMKDRYANDKEEEGIHDNIFGVSSPNVTILTSAEDDGTRLKLLVDAIVTSISIGDAKMESFVWDPGLYVSRIFSILEDKDDLKGREFVRIHLLRIYYVLFKFLPKMYL